jgi:hypothetical protein
MRLVDRHLLAAVIDAPIPSMMVARTISPIRAIAELNEVEKGAPKPAPPVSIPVAPQDAAELQPECTQKTCARSSPLTRNASQRQSATSARGVLVYLGYPPSLAAQGGQRLLSYFNIQRGISLLIIKLRNDLTPLPPQNLAVKGAHRGGRCRASDPAVPCSFQLRAAVCQIASVGTTRRAP